MKQLSERYLPGSFAIRSLGERIQRMRKKIRESSRTARPLGFPPRGSVLLSKVEGAWKIVPASRRGHARFLGELANYVMSFQGLRFRVVVVECDRRCGAVTRTQAGVPVLHVRPRSSDARCP